MQQRATIIFALAYNNTVGYSICVAFNTARIPPQRVHLPFQFLTFLLSYQIYLQIMIWSLSCFSAVISSSLVVNHVWLLVGLDHGLFRETFILSLKCLISRLEFLLLYYFIILNSKKTLSQNVGNSGTCYVDQSHAYAKK